MIGAYNTRRPRPVTYPERTLGRLVAWFTDPAQCPAFAALSDVTQEEYKDRLQWLEPEFDAPLDTVTQAAIYDVRDRCVKEKWPAFADKMVTALSTMFTLAAQRGWMLANPALGIKRTYKPDPDANREWRSEEWEAVMARAPLHLRTAYIIARHLGYRSQSIVRVEWSNYLPDPRFGKCFRMSHKKNHKHTREKHWMPASPVLQEFLASLKVRAKDGPIALRFNGQPWESASQLQKQSSNFLAKLTAGGVVAPGLTLHGLRVSFAAEIKRITGANDDQVAAALGDRDTRMGAYYTRHVEQEARIIQLFFGTRTEQDLENGRTQVFQNTKNTKKISLLNEKGEL
jgi:integrase